MRISDWSSDVCSSISRQADRDQPQRQNRPGSGVSSRWRGEIADPGQPGNFLMKQGKLLFFAALGLGTIAVAGLATAAYAKREPAYAAARATGQNAEQPDGSNRTSAVYGESV